MTERYRRNNQSDTGRDWDQNWQNPRQQQQFSDQDYRQSGGYDEQDRNRGWESQQGSDYYSSSGSRNNRGSSYGQDRDRDYGRGDSGRSYGRSDYGRSDYDDQDRWSGSNRDRQDRDYQGTMRSGYYGGSYSDRSQYDRDRSGSDRSGGYSAGYGDRQRSYGYGGSDYGQSSDRFQSFTGNDYGGRDFARGSNSLYGASSSGSYGRQSDRNDYSGWRDYGESRGFLERAGDEIASWFGDEDAARRRRQDHRGRGPEGYTRSDERIREDVNDALTHDWAVDASKITVKVDDGEVTLDGTVSTRTAKRKAEDCVEDVSGVKHVQNNLRVQDSSDRTGSSTSNTMTAGSTSSGVSTTGSSTTGAATTGATGSGSTRTTR